MRLEELPEIKEGTIAEIEFLNYLNISFLRVQIPLHYLQYVMLIELYPLCQLFQYFLREARILER